MKKPEQSVKRRKAAAKRAENRSKRAKKSQKEKHIRMAKKREILMSEKRKFDQHIDRLMGQETAY
jgi:hypothetical protein